MKSKILAIGIILVMLLTMFTGCSSEDENKGNATEDVNFDKKVELTWAMAGTRGVGSGCAVDKLSEMLEERTNGAITVNCIDGGALGNDAELVNQLIDGTVDVVSTSIGTVTAYYEPLGSIQTPFLIDSYDDEYQVIQSGEWKALVEAANSAMGGARIMATTENGMRHFAFSDKLCTTVADLAKTKIRTGGSDVVNKAIRAIGANPTTIPMTETFSALQNGIVDGMEINYAMISMMSFYEVINSVSEVNMYPWVTFELMSESTIESLPEGYYEVIQQCFDDFQTWWWTEGLSTWADEAKQDCVDNGVEIVEFQEIEKIKELCEAIYDKTVASDEKAAALIEFAQGIK